jgi:hypothetical protein
MQTYMNQSFCIKGDDKQTEVKNTWLGIILWVQNLCIVNLSRVKEIKNLLNIQTAQVCTKFAYIPTET